MKRKLFTTFMVACMIVLAVMLFIAMICGAPAESTQVGKYIFCAAVVAILLPAGFLFFFMKTVDLSKKLEEQNEESQVSFDIDEALDNNSFDIPVSVLVNALANKRNLTKEEKKELLAYLEDFEDES